MTYYKLYLLRSWRHGDALAAVDDGLLACLRVNIHGAERRDGVRLP